jgi:hypothetical protein
VRGAPLIHGAVAWLCHSVYSVYNHMIKKKQLVVEAGDESLTAAEQLYALAS